MKKKFFVVAGIVVVIIMIAISFNGCALFQHTVNELRGDITGNTYKIDTFDYFGEQVLNTHGEHINVTGNTIDEQTYSSEGGSGTVKTLSSVITINIDGKQLTSCGDTMIFYEDGLVPDVNFKVENINSTAGGIEDSTAISGIVNKYKNWFGKPVVVVIKSQTGHPLYAFSGEKVIWEVPDNLPKFTKLTVDGKQLYIHRANFQIIDKDLVR